MCRNPVDVIRAILDLGELDSKTLEQALQIAPIIQDLDVEGLLKTVAQWQELHYCPCAQECPVVFVALPTRRPQANNSPVMPQ